MMHELRTVRVYQLDDQDLGHRVLVDRLWPRGVKKAELEPFEWAKEVTPSTELRKWFGHDPQRFEEFAGRYRSELDENPAAAEFRKTVAAILKDQDVLLLYAAKDLTYNHANVLRDWLLE